MKKAMNWKELFRLPGNRKSKLLLIAGLAVILLIFLSCFWPKKAEPSTGNAVQTGKAGEGAAGSVMDTTTSGEYEARYQKRVEELVDSIAGAGRAQVVVTLDSGVEYVYAKEENKSNDLSGGGTTQSTRSTLDQKTILVEDANGRKTALLRKTLEPKVRGVVVVCEGGGDPIVAERVTEAVKTALGIPSTRVCVTQLSAAG